MASTYSTNLALELIGTGEQSGTWGTTTNTNLGTLLEQAISGYVTQAITDGSGANTTITIPNGATGVARNMFIEMTGALSFSTTSLIVPANKKMYFVFNNTSGGFAVTVKVSGQTGILVPNGKKVVLTCNGTDIVEAHTAIVGNATMGGTLGVTGATTLSSTLAVTGITTVAAGSAALPAIVSTTGTADTGLWFPAADTVAASTAGTEKLRIDSSGNVGIGTTSPSTYGKLAVSVGNSSFMGATTSSGSSGGAGGWQLNSYYGSVKINYIDCELTNGTPAAETSVMRFATIGSGTLAERMRIDSSGNVGIGTSSPSYRLDVQAATATMGLQSTTGTNSAYLAIANSAGNTYFGRDTSTGGVFGTAYATVLFSQGAYPMNFYTNSLERMRIDSSGNVGIGTTTPAHKLDVATASGNAYINVARNALASGQVGLQINGGTSGTIWFVYTPVSSNDLAFFGNGAERMRIDSSGQLILKRTAAVNSATLVCSAAQNTRAVSFVNNNNNNEVGYIFLNNDGTTTQYATTSDYRLKENVTPMLGALSVVAQLKPVTYKWKINGSDGQGFIAHELQAVVPECVTGEKDGVEIYTDVDGNEQTRPKYQGIDTSFLVATLTAAIQELKAIIDTQATRIAALEAKA